MTDQSYVEENRAELARMRALVARLSDAELARELNPHWTVAGTLGHSAFWDARVLALLDKWEGGSAPSQADWEPENVDWINDASRLLIRAVPPRALAELSLSIAEETDRRVAAASSELIEANRAAGSPLNLWRAAHRREHLDEIEALFARA